jgi:hypothetical protein
MSKLIAIRVSPALKVRLKRQAAAAEMPVSEFVRRAIEKALDAEPEPSLYESGRHLIGKYDSGRGDLSTRHSAVLKEKLRAKRPR